jgi:hypothetical protein
MRRETKPKEIVLKLSDDGPVNCPDCGLPVGKIVRGEFHFFSHHHGEKHRHYLNLKRQEGVSDVR